MEVNRNRCIDLRLASVWATNLLMSFLVGPVSGALAAGGVRFNHIQRIHSCIDLLVCAGVLWILNLDTDSVSQSIVFNIC